MEYAGLYLCCSLLVLLVGRRQLGLWVLWCAALAIVVKAVMVSSSDGLGGICAVKVVLWIFSVSPLVASV